MCRRNDLGPRASNRFPAWHLTCLDTTYDPQFWTLRLSGGSASLRTSFIGHPMHSRSLVELAARLVLESIQSPPSSETTVELAKQYWTASKCRLESWQRALRIFTDDLKENDPWHDPWPATEVVVQEILISELLTRVWSAVLIQRDQTHEANELTGVAQSVFISHMEVSSQALRLLMAQNAARQAGVQQLNVLRRRIERWTDLLLACLPDEKISVRFAHDRERMLEFAAERRQLSADARRQANRILLASISADVKKNTGRLSANPELNRQIAAGVMAFLPSEQFDSIGLPKTDSQLWIEQTLDETDVYLQEFRRLCEATGTGQTDDRILDLLRAPFRRL